MPESVPELVQTLTEHGVRVFAEHGRLECRGPRDILTPALLEEVRSHKEGIVAYLEGEDGPHPLTAGQRSLLLHQRLTSDSPAYNLAFAAHHHGPIDEEALDSALRTVLARHAVLRTTYTWDDGEPIQHADRVPERVLDTETVGEGTADRVIESFMDRPFDLEGDLPVRALLLRTSPEDRRPVLVLVVHHIASDLWSIDVIVEEWLTAYRAHLQGHGAQLPELSGSFVSHVHAEAAWLNGAEAERNLAFWGERLSGGVPVTNLPLDRPRPAAQTFRGDRLSAELDPALSRRLARLARDADATPNMLFLSALQVLLRTYGGSDEVIVGTPAAGPRAPHYQDTVGFFADPVVVRANLAGDPAFTHVLDATRTEVLRALDHPYPFPLLVEHLNPKRDPSRSPFFQVMYVWQQTRQWNQDSPLDVLAASGQRGAPYDLVLAVHQADERYVCTWTYNTALFERSTVERLTRGLHTLLGALADRPDAPVSALPVLADGERRTLLRDARGSAVPLEEQSWLAEFVAQVQRTPRAPALVCGEESVSYERLDERVGRLAAALRARGVREETRVGLCAERSVDLVVAMLAIARAGGAYVPLDPAYPPDRVAYMVDDARVALCVADETGSRALRSYGGTVVPLDALAAEAAHLAPAPLPTAAPEALAYVIYTSGSTGHPKGVMITRRNVTNLFAGLDEAVGGEPPTGDGQPVWLAVTSVCFDISVLELLWTLCRGYKVVVENARWTSRPEATASHVARKAVRPVDFSLFYFAAETGERKGSALYRLLMDGARFADRNGFRAVWVPERHFHAFGGAYPNPSVLAGAVAAVTNRVEIRAGSVVLPLQDPLRVTEEWAAVDNLSDGRVGLSFASGWQPDDFVLAPERFADRKESMWRNIDTVRRLWEGEEILRRNGLGDEVKVSPLPRPVQSELPVWATAAGSEETFRRAGENGAHLLTHLLGQNVRELARKVGVYRAARAAAGHDEGVVTLMLHTFVHPDMDVVREAVREPFKNYLRSSIDLMRGLAQALGLDPELHREVLVDHAFERYFATSALFGTPESCAGFVRELSEAGVDEIACLIDFGVDEHLTTEALEHLAHLKGALARELASPAHTPAESLARHGVTHLQCTPALARYLLLERERGTAPGGPLRRLLVGGDATPPELAARLREAGVADVFNMYGPTETCVWSAVQPLEPDGHGRVTFGGPLANTALYVLDATLRPVPMGVSGELHIGGTGVGRGYWNRPALTAERFRPDPFTDRAGARMYATGDIVRPLGGGRFEFLGRADHQVKVRGFRIEFGEIEAVLGAHPALAGCAVVARSDHDGDASIVAFVLPREGAPYDEASVRERARETLPEYMMPSRVVAVDSLPLTLNGKVDRGRLSAMAADLKGGGQVAYVAPRNRIEDALQRIWQEVLDREGVGIHENFFEIGGHSLLAAKAHARITAADLGHVELVDLFTYPTIAQLATHLGADPDGGGARQLSTTVQSRADRQKAAVRRRQRRRQGS
ncbi:MupA/Atu3671 family FMN-dependent luciferase-like monooxygenase [Streptomyces paromomycinus]|uniref:Non-ribosomal peptide synthetase n=1 Tax=Streptomyces paromomycinus TaxID=92743 RepID=A0A401VUQ4_STREY|nr:MupA/Atu3671 family FMN-dependent luciferase-like monooxygenase [Streptomyces paromomycinus]GCD40786.1 non-ribosomal peptide synthetase [Streptomyces paromomycinus]